MSVNSFFIIYIIYTLVPSNESLQLSKLMYKGFLKVCFIISLYSLKHVLLVLMPAGRSSGRSSEVAVRADSIAYAQYGIFDYAYAAVALKIKRESWLRLYKYMDAKYKWQGKQELRKACK